MQIVPQPSAPFALQNWGLYIHIPFCSQLCSYCDFAKTSRYSTSDIKAYLDVVLRHLNQGLEWLRLEFGAVPRFQSVFFGGGTPGLLGHEYEPLFDRFMPHLVERAEISIEVNPENVTDQNCRQWHSLGFNRVSMGVQSFNPRGLKSLGRNHDSASAVIATELLLKFFPNLNLDLIYGWREQSVEEWRMDLRRAVDLSVPHLSLYNLIFESGTPLGRQVLRRGTEYHSDESLEIMYATAREELAQVAYEHEEVSNWSRPGYSCVHNWIYWDNAFYLSVGAGSHGHLKSASGDQWRVAMTPHWRRYMLQGSTAEIFPLTETNSELFECTRLNSQEILTEVVATSIRTNKGVNLTRLRELSGREFVPSDRLRGAIASGQILLQNGFLILRPEEWFREQYWAVELLRSY